jgi:hypothetical protein
MKRNLDYQLRTIKGEPLRSSAVVASGEPPILTVLDPVLESLLSQLQDERPTAQEKIQRYKLAHRLVEGGTVDLTPEDLALIKRLVGAAYPPLVVGQVHEWCDRDEAQAEAKP